MIDRLSKVLSWNTKQGDTGEPEIEMESTTGTPTAKFRHGMETWEKRPATGTTERTIRKEKGNDEEQHEGEGSELEGAPNEDGLRTPSEMKAPGPICTEGQDYPESKDLTVFVHNYQYVISKKPYDSNTITVAVRKRVRTAMEEIRNRYTMMLVTVRELRAQLIASTSKNEATAARKTEKLLQRHG
ncbi:hypothetical protein FQA39_LY03247 [Lamprigera yunnana]|nr:hypothetical protein FQA39_LY03247 [Lamprigera yunnana]